MSWAKNTESYLIDGQLVKDQLKKCNKSFE